MLLKNLNKILQNHFLRYLFFSILLIQFYVVAAFLGIKGISVKIQTTENFIWVFLLLLFYFPNKKNSRSVLFGGGVVVFLYILFDLFYEFLKRSPHPSDFLNINTITEFSWIFSSIFYATIFLGFFFFSFMIWHSWKYYSKKQNFILWFLKIILFVLVVKIASLESFQDLFYKKFSFVSWSQRDTIRKNGRFSSFFYYYICSEKNKIKLEKYKEQPIDIYKILYANQKIKDKRNIYIVVLESFLDPRLIQGIEFDSNPLAKPMEQYLFESKFSTDISPIYGGGTAQSEFEVLTGLRALSLITSVEFNTLTGKKISSFVNFLRLNGYESYANIATSSKYFNSLSAYKSIGFETIKFLEETSDFKEIPGDPHIFDGDLYKYNIKDIRNLPKNKPYLFYTLGMYGHLDYDRNKVLRKDKISINIKDKNLFNISNQFFYRTNALAKYIKQILELDSKAIIFVTSDHLPPIFNEKIKYTKEINTNICLLLDGNKKVKLENIPMYKISQKILRLLSLKESNISEEDHKSLYYKALSQGI